MEKIPEIKFTSFENFILRSERNENPLDMPYVSCSVSTPSDERHKDINEMLHEDLNRMFKESGVDKEIIGKEVRRDFLKDVWQRDKYLYFNSTYFPWRWVDTKGQVRPEREAYVLKVSGRKDSLNTEALFKRLSKDDHEGVLAIGEGGLYFPDHYNKTLLISRGIISEYGNLSDQDLDRKIKEMHMTIFGDDIKIGILPQPNNTPHLDTHLTVVPGTQIALLEHQYYKKVELSGELEVMKELGYTLVQIPESSINCPLNIMYQKNSQGNICAFMNSRTPDFVKDILLENGISSYEMSEDIASALDDNDGGLRCVTNELSTKDPKLVKKLGFE